MTPTDWGIEIERSNLMQRQEKACRDTSFRARTLWGSLHTAFTTFVVFFGWNFSFYRCPVQISIYLFFRMDRLDWVPETFNTFTSCTWCTFKKKYQVLLWKELQSRMYHGRVALAPAETLWAAPPPSFGFMLCSWKGSINATIRPVRDKKLIPN